MRYKITFTHDRKHYQFLVAHKPIDARAEHFILIAGNKTITIESNRPLFRNKGLKHRGFDLKIRGQAFEYQHFGIVKAIYHGIEGIVSKYLE